MPDSAAKYHLVQLGQTLYGISRFYNSSVDSIVKWNQLENKAVKFSQLIIVNKVNQSISKSYWAYMVNENIAWDKIIEDTGKKKEEILLWNQKSKLDLLAGEQLKIKR